MNKVNTATQSLRAVALFEASKGILTILAGFGILTLLHRDVEAIVASLVRALGLNPDGTFPALFLHVASEITDGRLWALFLIGLAYALVRFTEAYGLWHERPWAEWFGTIAGAIYIPFELYELYLKLTWVRIGALLINIVVVGVLILNIQRRLRARGLEES